MDDSGTKEEAVQALLFDVLHVGEYLSSKFHLCLHE